MLTFLAKRLSLGIQFCAAAPSCHGKRVPFGLGQSRLDWSAGFSTGWVSVLCSTSPLVTGDIPTSSRGLHSLFYALSGAQWALRDVHCLLN